MASQSFNGSRVDFSWPGALLALLALLAPSTLMAVDKDEIEDMFDKAWTAVEVANEGRLTEEEFEKFKSNTKRKLRRHVDDDGDWDREARHFRRSVDSYGDDDDDLWEHIEECKVCNPFVEALLRGTGIDSIPFYDGGDDGGLQAASICVTSVGSCALNISSAYKGQSCYCIFPTGTAYGIAR